MRTFLKTYGAPLVSGLSAAVAFPPVHAWPVAWLALVPLLYHDRAAPPLRIFRNFFLAGFVFYALLLHWLLTNVYWGGGWAVVGYLALSAIMALYWGVTGAVWRWLAGRLPRVLDPLVFAALWVSMEFLQSVLFTGFGWGALGYSQAANLRVAQWAALGSVFGVSGLLALVNALAAYAMDSRKRWPAAAVAALLVAAVHGAGAIMLGEPDYESRPVRVGLFQSNYPLEMKWDPQYQGEMVRNAAQHCAQLAAAQRVDLFVWPETLVMTEIDDPEAWAHIRQLTADTGTALFTGSHRVDEARRGARNSSYLITRDGAVAGYYDKIHLAPFGEYVPLGQYFPFIEKIVPAIGDIEAGDKPKVFDVSGRRLGPLICFEVLFPEMAEALRGKGADTLVVVTNLAWFGWSAAQAQELEIARMRAIETRLPLIHSTNTGITGVIDPWGRLEGIQGSIALNGRSVTLSKQVRPEETTHERIAAAFRVPAPGTPPLPHAPFLFPRITLAVTALLLVAAWALGARWAGGRAAP